MKKGLSVSLIVCMVLGMGAIANASTYRERVEKALGNQKTKQYQKTLDNQKTSGLKNGLAKQTNNFNVIDIRIITPAMDYRERVEVMRDIKKRAAASRNALIQAAKN